MAEIKPQDFNLKTQVLLDKIVKGKKMFPLELRDHSAPVNRVILNRSNTLFATCSNDFLINIYNAITFELINQFKLTMAASNILFTDKDDRIIITTHLDQWYIFSVYEYQNEQDFFEYSNQSIKVMNMSLSYGDNYLALLYNMFNVKVEEGVSRNRLVIYDFKNLKPNRSKWQTDGSSTVISRDNFLVEKHSLKSKKGVEFTKVIFFLYDDVIFLADNSQKIYKYKLNPKENDINDAPELTKQLESVGGVNSLTFSPKFEFLMANCQEGLVMMDPETLETFRMFKTKQPVLCSQVSHLLYNEKNPKYHVIFAGGIPAREQAMAAEGGNEIFVYNFAVGNKITELSGCFGNVNWLASFKDGSGFITAGEEAYVRVYRFDKSYYESKDGL